MLPVRRKTALRGRARGSGDGRVPATAGAGFARDLNPAIVQLHSKDYRNPSHLRDGGVLIVGAGNSGAEIAMDLARGGRHIWMSGRSTGHIPFRIDGLAARLFLQSLVLRFVFHRVLTIKTPMGRKMRPKVLSQGGPLIRVKPGDLETAGVERVGRIAGVRDGLPVLEDGRALEVANVVWCTGFCPGFSWIHAPVLEENGFPKHDAGVAVGEPGLYFVGLPFIYAFSSTMIHGVGRDAARIAQVIEDRVRTAAPTSFEEVSVKVSAALDNRGPVIVPRRVSAAKGSTTRPSPAATNPFRSPETSGLRIRLCASAGKRNPRSKDASGTK